MKKQTKNILTKLALVAAPFAFAATITTSAVSANADSGGDWIMTPAEKASAEENAKLAQQGMEENGTIGQKSDDEAATRQANLNAQYAAQDARNEKEFNYSLAPTKKASSTTTKKVAKKHAKKTTKKKVVKKHAKRVAKKHVAKKHASKKATKKHVAKKRVVKKHARKHARRLFRIRVKAHKIYAYKSVKFHKAGRKAEKKGTKLYVYGIVKKGHKTFYKVYGGRVITSAHKYVTKIAK